MCWMRCVRDRAGSPALLHATDGTRMNKWFRRAVGTVGIAGGGLPLGGGESAAPEASPLGDGLLGGGLLGDGLPLKGLELPTSLPHDNGIGLPLGQGLPASGTTGLSGLSDLPTGALPTGLPTGVL